MTTDTALCAYGGMVKDLNKPVKGAMAHIAGLYRRDMRGAHARGDCAIVTTRARALGLVMIEGALHQR